MTREQLHQLFEPKPETWGLRGDPYLWQEMQRSMQSGTAPQTVEELEQLLHQRFFELTGSRAEGEGSIHVEKFEHGGMSSGHVSIEFWLQTAFPLLLQRATDYDLR
ncbi:MAG: hypothetical protein K9G41_10470 [Flavobacteriales bacterium]|nr:hypothetical protein [Flavobacteriales bacterium]